MLRLGSGWSLGVQKTRGCAKFKVLGLGRGLQVPIFIKFDCERSLSVCRAWRRGLKAEGFEDDRGFGL